MSPAVAAAIQKFLITTGLNKILGYPLLSLKGWGSAGVILPLNPSMGDSNKIGVYTYNPTDKKWYGTPPAPDKGQFGWENPAPVEQQKELTKQKLIKDLGKLLEGGSSKDPDLQNKIDQLKKQLLDGFGIGMLDLSMAENTISPLIVDLNGDGISTLSKDNGVYFDHDGNHFAERTGWVNAQDGLLVRDLNGDGLIDSGRELFGSETLLANGQKAKNGFDALAELDSNGDHVFDSQDNAFNTVKVWQDANSNGVVDSGELLSLAQADIASIGLTHSSQSVKDSSGNFIKELGGLTTLQNVRRSIADVWFAVDRTNTLDQQAVSLPANIAELPDLAGIGSVPSLQQAIARSQDGILQSLVQQFAAANDENTRKSIFEQLLYHWTGADHVDPQSRGSYFPDARKLAVLEAFWGEEYLQKYGINAGTANPGPNASAVILQSWNDIENTLYQVFMLQTHLSGLLNNLDFDITDTGLVVNSTAIIDELQATWLQDSSIGAAQITSFGYALQSVGSLGQLILTQLHDAGVTGSGDFSIALTHITDIHQTSLLGGYGNDVLQGTGLSEMLLGGDGNDTLIGAAGNDTLNGGKGNDFYVFNRGDGFDVIDNSGDLYEGVVIFQDVIQLGAGIARSDLVFYRQQRNSIDPLGSDLDIGIANTNDILRIQDFFVHDTLSQIRFANGELLTRKDVMDFFSRPSIGSDVVFGTMNDDTINVMAGNDLVWGLAGNDLLIGGEGDDDLNGGEGNDTLDGGLGNDQLAGGLGNDIYRINDASDRVIEQSDEGNDTVIATADHWLSSYVENLQFEGSANFEGRGNAQNNLIIGGGGNDSLFGDEGSDTILGGAGNDTVYADYSNQAGGNDLIYGDDGDDTLNGGQGDDLIYGGVGNDKIYGDDDKVGNDTLYGGLGDDIVSGGDGNDLLYGEIGNDALFGGAGDDSLEGSEGNDSLSGEEGNDSLYGGLGNDSLFGGAGDDYLEGSEGNNTLVGDDGSDSLYGAAGDDSLFGGAGDDYLNGGEGNNYFDGGEGNDSLYGRLGEDTLFGGAGDDYLDGSEGNDYLNGGEGNDFIKGGVGRNSIDAGVGDDTVDAGSGNDVILGGDGADILQGGAGDDLLYGGEGSDHYVFNVGDGKDVIYEEMNDIDTQYLDNAVYFNFNTEQISKVVRENNDLLISYGIEDQVRVKDYYLARNIARHYEVNPAFERIEISSFHFSDGVVWDTAHIMEMAPPPAILDLPPASLENVAYFIDALIGREPAVLVGHHVITYSFASLAEQENNFVPFTLAQTQAIERALSKFSDVLNVQFVKTTTSSDITFLLDDLSSGEASAAAGYVDDSTGKVHLNSRLFRANDSLNEGKNGFEVVLHELGHILGLKHPFEAPVLPRTENTQNNTLMSYTSNFINDTDLKLFDIAALQYLYGVNPSFQAWHNQYGFYNRYIADGAGIDTFSADYQTERVFIDLNQGGWSYLGSKQSSILADNQSFIGYGTVIENAIAGMNDDTLIGNSADNRLAGRNGNDTLIGGQGNDELLGEEGADEYRFTLGDGIDSIVERGNDSVISFNNVSVDILSYMNGSFYYGVSGERVEVDINAIASVIVNGQVYSTPAFLTAYNDLQMSDSAIVLDTTTRKALLTGYANVSITGNQLANVLGGNDGHNLLDGGLNADTLIGGLGDDSYRVDNESDKVVELFNQGNDTVIASANYALSEHVENLTLVGSAVRAQGNALNNILTANALGNQLEGKEGNDTLIGGAGNDRFDGGTGANVYVVHQSGGLDTIIGIGLQDDELQLDVRREDLKFRQIGSDLLIDLGQGQVRVTDHFKGSGYTDTALGAIKTADGYRYDTRMIRDLTTLPSTTGDDVIYIRSAAEYVDALSGNDSVYGSFGDDTIKGGAGNDTLTGGLGVDSLIGGTGDDTYWIDTADTVIEANNEGTDTVYTSNTYTLASNIENAELQSTDEATNLTGNSLNNILTAGKTLIMHAYNSSGANQLAGGLGDDTYQRVSSNDVVVEQANAGIDTVYYSGNTLYLWDNVENVVIETLREGDFILSSYQSVYGNALDNRITANNNVRGSYVDGGDGNDTLIGLNGKDWLQGGNGNDTLLGGAGDDTLVGDGGYNVIDGGTGTNRIAIGDQYYGGGSGVHEIYGGQGTNIIDMYNGTAQAIIHVGQNDKLNYIEHYSGGEAKVDLRFDSFSLNDGYISLAANGDVSIQFGNSHLTMNRQAITVIQSIQTSDGIMLTADWLQWISTRPDHYSTYAQCTFTSSLLSAEVSPNLTRNGSDILFNNNAVTRQGEKVQLIDPASLPAIAALSFLNDVSLQADIVHIKAKGAATEVLIAIVNNIELMVGTTANDTFVSTQRSLTQIYAGGQGQDTYRFGLGDGSDEITASAQETGQDRVELLDGLTTDNVIFRREYTDLWLDVIGTNDHLKVTDYFGIGDSVGVFQWRNGSVSNRQTVLANLGASDSNDTVQGTVNNDTLYGFAGNDSLLGQAGDDTLWGDAGNDTLSGGIGNDSLLGGLGNDSLLGGVGDDYYDIDSSSDAVIENTNEGNDSVNSSVSYQLTANVENLYLVAGKGALNAVGNSLNNALVGNESNNRLDGGLGADELFGEAGDDTYIIDNIADNANEYEEENSDGSMTNYNGNDTVESSITYTLGNFLENLTLTGTAAINGTGNGLNNRLIGNSAANILKGGLGDDTYVVGTGDTVTESSNQGIDTLESAITWTLGSHLENLILTGITAINGTGNTLVNKIVGNSAANILNGGTGADVLLGGLGDDVYVVDNIADVTTESLNEGSDTVQSSVTWMLGNNIENLTLTGTTAINGTGNSLNNTLTGNTAANILKGGLGNDTYVVGTGDTVTENANEGIDTVQSSVTWTLASNVENLTLTGTTAINGTGNSLDNLLTGNSAKNTLKGGLGNDVYIVSTGDIITENANEGSDSIQSSITWTLAANVENLTLTGTTAINGTGNTLANTLSGNSANNTLTGLAGNDTYLLNAAWATDTILDNDSTANNVDIARFGSGISRDQLWFKKNGTNLEVSRIGTTDKLIISNWYTSTAYHVEQFKTHDNFTLDHNKVAQLVQAMSAMTAPPSGQTTLTTAQHQQLDAVIASSWV